MEQRAISSSFNSNGCYSFFNCSSHSPTSTTLNSASKRQVLQQKNLTKGSGYNETTTFIEQSSEKINDTSLLKLLTKIKEGSLKNPGNDEESKEPGRLIRSEAMAKKQLKKYKNNDAHLQHLTPDQQERIRAIRRG